MKKTEIRHIMQTMSTLFEFGACDSATVEIKLVDINRYNFKIESVHTGLIYFIENLTKAEAVKLFVYCYAIKLSCKVDNRLFFAYVAGE